MRYIIRHMQRGSGGYWLPLTGFVLLLALVVAFIGYLPRQAAFAASTNWSTFLGNLARTGYNGKETTINTTTASTLKLHWTDSTGACSGCPSGHARVTDEVMVANGMIYWGSWDGELHASDPATGKDVWAVNLGTKPGACSGKLKGVVGSPTIARVPINGVETSVVFVAAGQDNVYALDARKGTILWQTNLGNDPAEFIFDSTAVYNGSVYIGISSTGDCPLTQGEFFQLNESTGAIQNTFKVVPDGCFGGGVWGSPAIDVKTGMIYFGTGNANVTSCTQHIHYGSSIIELRAADLSFVASWHIPTSDMVGLDNDFGSTPTLFQATISGVSHAMLGMIDKDGYYYALDRTNISAGALWKVKISVGGSAPASNASIAASAYDFTSGKLYVAGSATTIGGQQCLGSLSELDPGSGAIGWQDCLTGPVLGPVIAVPGLVVVGAGNTMSVVNSQTGATLFSYQDTLPSGNFWGAATIFDGTLYDGSLSGTLFAFGL